MNPSAAGPYLRRTIPSSAAFYHKLAIVQLSANEPLKNANHPRLLSWDWPAAMLAMACVLLAGARLVATQATDHLFLVSFLAVLGCIAGFALGRSLFTGWLSTAFGLLYGLFFVPWQLGLAFFADQEWTVRLRDLGDRLGFAISQFGDGENVEDPLLFITAMAILFWVFGLNAGYRLARRADLWGALIPFGLAALVVQTYDPRDLWKAWLLALFSLCLLLLQTRLQLLRNRMRWERAGVYVPFELSSSLTRLSFLSAAILVLLAWGTPTLASSLNSIESFWTSLTTPWTSVRDEIGRVFFPLQGGLPRARNYFGEQFLLGRGIPQSSDILFTAEVNASAQFLVRPYWRDRVYDRYENGIWTSDYEKREVWSDVDPDQFTDFRGRTLVEFQVMADENLELLHAVSQPIALDRAAEFSFAQNEDGYQDLAALFAQSPVLPGETYVVQASVAVPTSDQLRAAGTAYPTWVSERYLQLPTDFSPQIAELAQILSQGQETPYNIAVVITIYLRREIEYVDQMPIAPVNRDPIEWMLFDQKQGFCNYYATAEVLMLRSLGIPARLAVGYAQGEPETAEGRLAYVVRLRDAHAWPEVFFPDIGWVEFEPTANQTPLTRPADTPIENLSEEELLRLLRLGLAGPLVPSEADEPALAAKAEDAETSAPVVLPNPLRPIFGMLVLFAIGAALLLNWKRIQEGLGIPELVTKGFARLDIAVPDPIARWARYSALSPVERAFLQINQALRWLGAAPKSGDTPEQRSQALAKLIPDLSNEIQTLSQDYQFRTYSRSKISREERALRFMKLIRSAARRQQVRTWIERTIPFLQLAKADGAAKKP
ncbi:MAG TPA: transglutaminase-like domain-containing protein [Anaerolineales bacterium]|nr:transglutaminase-like domain-containing protein [Anaerolineales bacterium]